MPSCWRSPSIANKRPWPPNKLHYVAIIEDAVPDHAVGVWFPDLSGCFGAEVERFAIALIPAPDIALQPAAE